MKTGYSNNRHMSTSNDRYLWNQFIPRCQYNGEKRQFR